MSAYLMVSLQSLAREPQKSPEKMDVFSATETVEPAKFSEHPGWDFNRGWKSTLNNLRLIIQPYVFFNLLKSWLAVFDIQCLRVGFWLLIEIMNEFQGYVPINSG